MRTAAGVPCGTGPDNIHSFAGCPSIVPGASAGVLYSPHFPWNYPAGISCDWLITVPWQRSINLNFTRFDLKPSSWHGSCSDYVLVRDENDHMIGKYCGSHIPPSIASHGTLIHVRFFSDFGIKSYSGFMAFYDLTGYSFPSTAPYPYWTTYPYHWTTYPPVHSPSAQSVYTCKPYSQTSKLSSHHN